MGSCINCGGRLKRQRRYTFKSAAFRKVYGDKFVYVCTQCGLYQADVSKIDEAALLKYYRTEYRAVAKIGVGDPGHRWYRARGRSRRISSRTLCGTCGACLRSGRGIRLQLKRP